MKEESLVCGRACLCRETEREIERERQREIHWCRNCDVTLLERESVCVCEGRQVSLRMLRGRDGERDGSDRCIDLCESMFVCLRH